MRISSILLTLAFTLTIVLSLSLVSASTELTIHLDDKGNAQFFGETSASSLSLPSGMSLLNGKISGITTSLTSKSGETWSFSYSLADSEMQIILPSNAIVKDTSGETFISRGKIVLYGMDEVKASYTLSSDTSTDILVYVVWALIVIVVFAAAIFGYKFVKKKAKLSKDNKTIKGEKPNRLEIVRNLLHERQRNLIDLLKKEKKIKSSYLRKLSEIPKASFSRHIQELEKKGLIKRYGEGKNKIIELINK
jgi:uncharacterized membrane protein